MHRPPKRSPDFDLRHLDLNLLIIFDVLMQERSVSKAADRLGRTQSTMSHALARLRRQLDDPLLIHVGGSMQPSPFAVGFAQKIGPILHQIQGALSKKAKFNPETSQKLFWIYAPVISLPLYVDIYQTLSETAPGVQIEWKERQPDILQSVLSGETDFCILDADTELPQGLAYKNLGALTWHSFVRSDHPGLSKWGLKTWLSYPHVAVKLRDGGISPISRALSHIQKQRRVAVWVPHFSAALNLVAHSDLITTIPTLTAASLTEPYRLVAKEVPFEVPDVPQRLIWAEFKMHDKEMQWMKSLIVRYWENLFSHSETKHSNAKNRAETRK